MKPEMCRQFCLYIQQPKTKKIGIGVISVGRNGDAHFFSGFGERDSKVLANMERVKMDFIGASGIHISGFERVGTNKNGTGKYIYQEWWLTYDLEEST